MQTCNNEIHNMHVRYASLGKGLEVSPVRDAYNSPIGSDTERQASFGYPIGSIAGHLDELVEKEVQVAEHSSPDVPVRLLGLERQIDHIDQQLLEDARGSDASLTTQNRCRVTRSRLFLDFANISCGGVIRSGSRIHLKMSLHWRNLGSDSSVSLFRCLVRRGNRTALT